MRICLLLATFVAAWAGAAAPGRADVRNPYAVAVIIGNKTYRNHDVPEVKFADRDAEAVRNYAIDVLGYPAKGIIFKQDATQADLNGVFGSADEPRGQLARWLRRDGSSDVLVYYSGHGVPGTDNGQGYLFPVDGDPNAIRQTGFPLNLLYQNLQKLGAHSVTVLLDACFTGFSGNGRQLLGNASVMTRPTVVTPPADAAGLIVLTASQSNQLANWDEEHRHGLFTEYFLEAVYGRADDPRYGGHHDGKITLGAVQKFLDVEMSFVAQREDDRDQDATVTGDPAIVLASLTPDRMPVRHDDATLTPSPVPPPVPTAPVAVPPAPAEPKLATHPRPGWLGIRLGEVTSDKAASLGLGEASGALVLDVTANGPADKAGLRPGDVILQFNGQDVKAMPDLPRLVAAAEPGRYAPMTIWRDRAQRMLPVTVGELSEGQQRAAELEKQGNDLEAQGQAARERKDYAAALDLFRQAADKGNAFAMNDLGFLYENGFGVSQNGATALRWYRQAADKGEANAMRNIGLLYQTGSGAVKQDYATAMQWYSQAADHGNDIALRDIGILYQNGYGVKQSYSEAMRWYRQAADKGNADAMNDVGVLFEQGNGVAQDSAQAATWFRKAADAGNEVAMRNLGTSYKQGRGVPPDVAEARRWFAKAAEQGDQPAQDELAKLDAPAPQPVPTPGAQGDDLEKQGEAARDRKDYAAAVGLFRQAADKGNAYAMGNLGFLYQNGNGVIQSDAEAMRWYRQAADKGDANAARNVGLMYQDGTGVPQSYSEALDWFRRAADQGNAFAMNDIGILYDQGQGVGQDSREAVGWFRKAADAGNEVAMRNLGIFYRQGRGTPVDLAEARRWFVKAADHGDQPARDELAKLGAAASPPSPTPAEQGSELEKQGEAARDRKDYAVAMRLFRQAADDGNAFAMNNIGFLYDHGYGVIENPSEALSWFRKSADKNDEVAMRNLGLLYKVGRGVPADPAEARQWFRKAADLGDQPARDELAKLDAAAAPATAAMAENALNLGISDRVAVQQWLGALGYATGGADGAFGPATRAAIAAYQRATGMSATGYLTAGVLARLQRDGQDRAQVKN